MNCLGQVRNWVRIVKLCDQTGIGGSFSRYFGLGMRKIARKMFTNDARRRDGLGLWKAATCISDRWEQEVEL